MSQQLKHLVKATVLSVSKDLTTAKVSIPRVVPDKMYGKRVHVDTDLLVDSTRVANLQVGCQVIIQPCRKISKRKAWRIVSAV